jgi:hypothetical protein
MLVSFHEFDHEDFHLHQGQVFPKATPRASTEDHRNQLLVLLMLLIFPPLGDELLGFFEDVGVVEEREPMTANIRVFEYWDAAYRRILDRYAVEKTENRAKDPGGLQDDVFQITKSFYVLSRNVRVSEDG